MPSHVLRRGLAAVTALLAVGVAAPSGSAAEVATPYLPRPTGPHPVGTTSVYLKDVSRPDPWVPPVNARELMVSLWYPAKSPGSRRARYMTPKESELLLTSAGITDVAPDILSRTRTNAYTDVTPAGGRRPLVVLSPGFTWPRSSLTALAEELASRGYLVAGVDHTYENFGMTFPDGRVATCAACDRPDVGDFEKAVVESRARDVPFVLDELIRKYPKWIDRSRIAMAGMSLGGASVGETMLADPRVRAGINLDGKMFKALPETGLSRPFLFFGPGFSRRLVGPQLVTPDRVEALAHGGRVYTPVLHRLRHVGPADRRRTRQQARRNPLRGDHPPLRPRLPRPTPTRRHRNPCWTGRRTRYPEVRFCAPETC